ncbi:hypothetical protein F5Y12DRAFT_747393 [Xylaria sp. FL1777]|nr:hypothetical protein F5Y12DRAFT_747393 [Xylaria sp. FL1777]
MSQKKRVSSRHHDTTPRKKALPHLPVWYCNECGFGPWNAALDEYCVNCGKQRCEFCPGEWVPVEEEALHDISVPRNTLRLEALQTANRVPHNFSQRAATPFDDTGCAISNPGHTLSPLRSRPPYLTHVGPGTHLNANAQGEAPAQPSSDLVSEPWNVSRSKIGLVPVPIYEPFYGTSSPAEVTNYNNTSPYLLSGSPQDTASLCQLPTQFDVGDSLQHISETRRSVGGTSRNIQQPPLESKARLKRKHVAVDNNATDAGAFHSGEQFAQACGIPVSLGRISLDPVSSGWPEFPTDASMHFPLDSQISSHSVGPAPPSWIPRDDYGESSQLYQTLSIAKSSQDGRATKGVSRCSECCKSSGSRRFACPFYKYDPKLHISCVLKSFNSIGHLGQHLKKHHKLGPIHCKLCWQTFDTVDSLTNHAERCKMPTGGVPVDKLPKFPRMRLPAEQKWCWAWKKLFGDAARLLPCPFSHPQEDFQVQFHAQSPELPHRTIGDEDESLSHIDYREGEEKQEEGDKQQEDDDEEEEGKNLHSPLPPAVS